MAIDNVSYQQMILSETGKEIDLLRFCLSDQVALSITAVLQGEITPVTYANKLLTHHYDRIGKKFFADCFSHPKIPQILKRSFVFDQIVITACLYRAIMIRSSGVEGVKTLMAPLPVHLLLLDHPNITGSFYSGLTNFEITADYFIAANVDKFNQQNTEKLTKIISHVSYLLSEEWFLHNTTWQKALMGKPGLIKALRRFLHSGLVSYLVTSSDMEALFSLTLDDVNRLNDEFILLFEQPSTPRNIVTFLKKLPSQFEPRSFRHFYAYLMEAPFEVLCQIDQQLYPHYHQLSL